MKFACILLLVGIVASEETADELAFLLNDEVESFDEEKPKEEDEKFHIPEDDLVLETDPFEAALNETHNLDEHNEPEGQDSKNITE